MCIPLLLLKDNELTETRIRPMIRSTIRQGFLQTFGGILLDDVKLISPRMQGTILITISKVDCSFFELWCQEKGCLHAQRIKDILLAVCVIHEQIIETRKGKSHTRTVPRTSLIPFPQGIRQHQHSRHRRLFTLQ